MARIFPQARDYRTETVKISQVQRKEIEARLGSELLPGQRDVFQYYRMTGQKGETVGYIIAASQKGQYGAVEFVLGLGTDHRIAGLYIQRERERDKEFKDRKFLDKFVGLSIEMADGLRLPPDRKSAGAKAVVLGLRKELIAFDVLVLRKETKGE